jgi:multidrug efflux pump subunit AcrB
MQTGKFVQPFSGYTVNVPQLDADIDREKAKMQNVPLQNIFDTLQINLGSLYVNDFNRFGRTYQVVAQAEAPFRDDAADILKLKTRNATGQMVPLASFLNVRESYGPSRVTHYNGYLASDLSASPGPGVSSGEAEALIQGLASQVLPGGFELDWTELVYQRIIAGDTAIYIYPLCILFVFLVLAAQYESLRLPLAIILIVPLCLLFALAGVMIAGGDNNIFT